METIAKFLGGCKFKVISGGHEILCDQPRDNGGEDAGMSPPEFLLASLASCAGYYASQYLKTRGLSSEGLEVRVTAEKAKQPARLGAFLIEVNVPGLEERHQAAILRAVKSCLVHNTLLERPSIEVTIQAPAEMPV
jgi:putative redox protein